MVEITYEYEYKTKLNEKKNGKELRRRFVHSYEMNMVPFKLWGDQGVHTESRNWQFNVHRVN